MVRQLWERGPTPSASAARHRPDRQWSKMMLNFGSWAGRLHAVLGAGWQFTKPHLMLTTPSAGLQANRTVLVTGPLNRPKALSSGSSGKSGRIDTAY